MYKEMNKVLFCRTRPNSLHGWLQIIFGGLSDYPDSKPLQPSGKAGCGFHFIHNGIAFIHSKRYRDTEQLVVKSALVSL